MDQTVWLSGSRGFVGTHLVRRLRGGGYAVTCVSNASPSDERVVHLDFADRRQIQEALDRLGAPEVFLHLGWGHVYQPQSPDHLTTNVQNGINLIDACFERGVQRIVMIGSSSEYGERVGALSEDLAPEGALNNYIKGKLALAAHGFEAAARLNRTFLHVRLSYTFGAGQQHDSLINQLFRSSVERTALDLSPCEHYRDYIYVGDVAEGIERISRVDRSAIVNLGGGKVIQLKEFIRLFWTHLGSDPDLLRFGAHTKPAHEPPQPHCYLDLARLKSLTHWTPTWSIQDGIADTVAQLRSGGVTA
ncbi:MAG: NAD(P)-dependent oxidoreductase [Chloroflexi bacterium]|nr:NAD(P)-dependent oxidoreductase [Chloroflexota bacterium]